MLVVLARMSQKGAPRKIFSLLIGRRKVIKVKRQVKAKMICMTESDKGLSSYFSSEYDDIMCEVKAMQATVDNLLALHEFFKVCAAEGIK